MQPLNESRYADHLRGCADLAKEIAARMDIREDSARQACLATIIISADRHNLLIEPTPPHTKTPAEPNGAAKRETHATLPPLKGTEAAIAADAAAAQKADAQITDVPKRDSTPDEDAGARRTALLAGINSARNLLIKEGHVPLFTPKYMNEFIKDEMKVDGNLGSLDVDQLEELIKLLNTKLDNLKHNKKALEADAPF